MEPHEVWDNLTALVDGGAAVKSCRDWFFDRWAPTDPHERARFESNLTTLLHTYASGMIHPILKHLHHEIELLDERKKGIS